MSRRILVAGVGNIFLSDDGFGVAVASRMAKQQLPPSVTVSDFGIRGVHLAFELLDGYDGLVLVDAVAMGEPPGTLALLDAGDGSWSGLGHDGALIDAHTMSPDVVFATLDRIGGNLETTYVLGCQPACLDEGIGLSPPVEAAVGTAINMCEQLLTDMLQPAGKGTSR